MLLRNIKKEQMFLKGLTFEGEVCYSTDGVEKSSLKTLLAAVCGCFYRMEWGRFDRRQMG